MITILIGILGVILLYITGANGDWGAFGVCAFIIIFLWLCASEERKDWEAYSNCREYWRHGGSYREARRSGDRVNVHTEVRVNAPVRVETESMAYIPPTGRSRCFVCVPCRKAVSDVGHMEYIGGRRVLSYYCPECGKRGMVVR